MHLHPRGLNIHERLLPSYNNFQNVAPLSLKLLCVPLLFQEWNKKRQGGIIRWFGVASLFAKAELQINFQPNVIIYLIRREKFSFVQNIYEYYDTPVLLQCDW
jgi:hypothetical protein